MFSQLEAIFFRFHLFVTDPANLDLEFGIVCGSILALVLLLSRVSSHLSYYKARTAVEWEGERLHIPTTVQWLKMVLEAFKQNVIALFFFLQENSGYWELDTSGIDEEHRKRVIKQFSERLRAAREGRFGLALIVKDDNQSARWVSYFWPRDKKGKEKENEKASPAQVVAPKKYILNRHNVHEFERYFVMLFDRNSEHLATLKPKADQAFFGVVKQSGYADFFRIYKGEEIIYRGEVVSEANFPINGSSLLRLDNCTLTVGQHIFLNEVCIS